MGKTLETISLIAQDYSSLTKDPKIPAPPPTLVVCPLSLMDGWVAEIKKHLKKNYFSKKVAIYYSQEEKIMVRNRVKSLAVVVTTYGTLQNELYPRRLNGQKDENSFLLTTQWHRLVLDEAHAIRNTDTKIFRACALIEARSRWALTGTPIQNYADDLFSYLSFLRLYPFRKGKEEWDAYFGSKASKKDNQAATLRKVVLFQVCMRRTKAQLDMPKKQIQFYGIDMSKNDHKAYNSLALKFKELVGRIKQGNTNRNEASKLTNDVLVLLLRVRQFCDDPYLFEVMERVTNAQHKDGTAKKDGSPTPDETLANLAEDMGLDASEDTDKSEEDTALKGKKGREEGSSYQQKIKTELTQSREPSTKTCHLINLLQRILSQDKTNKVVVFTQFSQYLELLSQALTKYKIRFSSFDGSSNKRARSQAIKDWQQKDGDIRVLMMTLKAGGVGLNLIEGNWLIICDPWWNPTIEDQAIDRIYRLGQTRPVHIVRLYMKGTPEEKVLAKQDEKRMIIQSTFEPIKTVQSDFLDMV